MEEMWENSAIIAKRNVDDNQNPISVQLSELKQIIDVHSCIVLNQLPDEFQSIDIEGYTEVDSLDKVSGKTFKVDYANGVLYFHPNNVGKMLTIDYYGTGYTLLSASRIITKYDKFGNVLETLEELIDKAKLYIKAIESLGGAVEVINKLDADIEAGGILHENLTEDIQVGTQVKDELIEKTNIANTTITNLIDKTSKGNETANRLDISTTNATKKKQELDNSISEATKTNTILSNTKETAVQTDLTLKQTIASGQSSIDKINKTGNKSLTIGASQFINNEYTWTHGLNSKELNISMYDADTDIPLMLDCNPIGLDKILVRNSVEHPNIRVVLSASYYQGNSMIGTTAEEFAGDSVDIPIKKVRLKDENGVAKNPITDSDAVFMSDGKTKLTKKIDNIEDGISLKLSKSDFTYNGIKNKPVITNNPLSFADYIYELDKISLSGTKTWSYYDGSTHPQFYPSVGLDKNGEIFFSGIAKIIDTDGQVLVGNMVKLGNIYHFSISEFEGVPLWGTFLGVNNDDENDNIPIPFLIKPSGDILIKNLGKGNKYYSKILLSSARVKTTGFGHQKVLEHIKSVKNTVLGRNTDTSFIYFTDLHYRINIVGDYRRYEQLNYMNLLKRELDLSCLVSGGDNVEEYNTKQKAIICKKDFLGNFEPNSLVYCNGNHDLNIGNGNNLFVHYSHVKPYINNYLTIYGGDDKYYGYTDYVDKKLRIVVLDIYEPIYNGSTASHTNTASDGQLKWIKENALLGCPSDYDVIVVSHVAPTPNKVYSDDTILPNAHTIRKMFEDFKDGIGDFSTQGNRRLACWFSGHEHKDKLVTINGITYVNTLLAGSTEVRYIPQDGEVYTTYSRILGTEYEFCFDIVSIDRTNRKVYIDRVGKVANMIGRTRVVSY